MDTRTAVTKRIEELCSERSITINGLSYMSGVANSTIQGIFYERSQNPGVVTIKKLCDGFEISLREFFNSPLFDDLEQEIQ